MNKKKVTTSFFWKLCECGSHQTIGFVIQIILARLLLPDDFGAIAIIGVFTNIANIFIQKGFSSSLIRKKNATEDDYNTALIVSEGIAFAAVLLLFAISPLVANYYDNPKIALYLRVMSLTLIFGAFYSIENAILIREMRFKFIFLRSFIATCFCGGLGVTFAYLGFGIWALIIQALSNQLLVCILSFFGCNWRPRLYFSKQSFNSLFSFGSKILAGEILFVLTEDLRTLIIAKRYSPTDLAYYNRGQVYPRTVMGMFYNTIANVMLPVLSQEQDNAKKLQESVELSLSLSIYLIYPIFVGMSAISNLFVLILLTEQWEASIPFLRFFSIYQLAFPIYGILRQSLYAIGDSNGVLKLEVVKGVVFIVAIIVGSLISPFGIAVSSGVAFYFAAVAYGVYVHKRIKYNIRRVFCSFLLSSFQCSIMYLVILLFNLLPLPNLVLLITDIPLGAGVYFGISWLFRNREFIFLSSLAKDYINTHVLNK